jgi:hypothetical protein
VPLPMVHLAVAVQLHEKEGKFPSPDFLLGSIAPDAIHMRPGTGKDDKLLVHLWEQADPGRERARRLLGRYASDKSEAREFAQGYMCHLLTDDLWYRTVIEPFFQSVPQVLSEPQRRSLYYLETDQIDFDIYHQAPWRQEVWSRLAAAQSRDFAKLLTAGEISQWRDRTLIWFEKLKQEPMIEPVHITIPNVNNFIDKAIGEMAKFFKGWESASSLKEHDSANERQL